MECYMTHFLELRECITRLMSTRDDNRLGTDSAYSQPDPQQKKNLLVTCLVTRVDTCLKYT